ncbi:MAG: hypothetical protein ABL931_13780 [Usitatibacteraceae bacterium]
MPTIRKIHGEIIFPADAAPGVAPRVLVEVRDVSAQDQPSVVLATTTLRNVTIGPGMRIPFALRAPNAAAERSLSMRVQVDMHADRSYAPGDFLTTAAHSVAAAGDVLGVKAHVTKI